jgi:hypothetical protein
MERLADISQGLGLLPFALVREAEDSEREIRR